METNFNFKSSPCTSIEQSIKLLALGLKKETADCCYYYYDGEYLIAFAEDAKYESDIPAWSLGRLVEIINKCNFESFKSERWKAEAKKFCRYVIVSYSDDLIENSIEMIEALIEKGYFNKEYLV